MLGYSCAHGSAVGACIGAFWEYLEYSSCASQNLSPIIMNKIFTGHLSHARTRAPSASRSAVSPQQYIRYFWQSRTVAENLCKFSEHVAVHRESYNIYLLTETWILDIRVHCHSMKFVWRKTTVNKWVWVNLKWLGLMSPAMIIINIKYSFPVVFLYTNFWLSTISEVVK